MDSTDGLSEILFSILVIMVAVLVVLIIIYLVLKRKSSGKEMVAKKKVEDTKIKKEIKSMKSIPEYNKQSIFDFMEFDSVQDNMIIQKNGKRYIMAIECQGINYDLMSQIEKVSVEEGFQQFLNTLRHPIQIYIQTRTINLEKSILGYKERVKEIEKKYNQNMYEYNIMVQSGTYSKQQLDEAYYNMTKQRNLYEYAKDIVNNAEQMSLNKNILNKKYYLIISYMPEEAGTETYSKEELRNMAFSELYTKAQTLIRTLSGCSVTGKILNSNELVELLYVAYNRDDSEVFGLEKALNAQYDDLYSTAPDVFEKKIRALDNRMKEEAVKKANNAIEIAKNKSAAERIAEEKENNMDELINKMAQMLIKENEESLGKNVAEKAIEEIDQEENKKGGEEDEKKKTTIRGRKKSSK